jgi:hypothetical protein
VKVHAAPPGQGEPADTHVQTLPSSIAVHLPFVHGGHVGVVPESSWLVPPSDGPPKLLWSPGAYGARSAGCTWMVWQPLPGQQLWFSVQLTWTHTR